MNDPAFLFYPGDYLRDTQCLSERSQVAYDRIMCEHMRNICISQEQLNFFTKRLTSDEKYELMMVLRPVPGGFQIPWVVDSIQKRRDYSESRRKNREGKKEKSSPKTKNTSQSYVPHMEIENEIVIEDEIDNAIRNAFDEIYLEQQAMKWTHLDFKFQFRSFCEKVRGSPQSYKSHGTDGLRLALQSQLRNFKPNATNKTKRESTSDLAAAFAERVRNDTNGK